jgi:hypothetical protein
MTLENEFRYGDCGYMMGARTVKMYKSVNNMWSIGDPEHAPSFDSLMQILLKVQQPRGRGTDQQNGPIPRVVIP